MKMRLALWWCGLVACCAGAAWAQTGAAALPETQERLFLPHDFLRGYLDFQVAPPHNEVDLGLCPASSGAPGSQTPNCAAFARYAWSGYIEVQPIGRGPLSRGFLFIEPKLFGGENLPQVSYTASPSLILFERSIGVGVELVKRIQLRVTQHEVKMLGRYGKPGISNIRTDGPYGLHATVGVRWYFGGYGHGPH